MKSLLAEIFRFLFKIPFFKHYFFAIHQRIFIPLNLFKGVVKRSKFKDDIFLELYIDDWIQENIYFLGTYEDAELQLIKFSLKDGDTFIDIGANIGIHSLFSSKIVGTNGHIVSFEPFSKNYKSFVKNISLNTISNITAENLAIGKTNTSINLYYDTKESNLGMVSSFVSGYSDFEKVKMVSLDSYLKDNPLEKIDLIKLDIEGGEYNALLGMKETLINYSPKLLIEILSDSIQENNKESILRFLSKMGYKLYFIDDFGKLSSSEKNTKRMNFAFVKE